MPLFGQCIVSGGQVVFPHRTANEPDFVCAPVRENAILGLPYKRWPSRSTRWLFFVRRVRRLRRALTSQAWYPLLYTPDASCVF